MISFYPGPSKLYPQVKEFLADAFDSGILSVNHRSTEFVDISKNLVKEIKTKLIIPEEYSVYFISSATEAWEIISQSLVRKKSFHIYNGAFGEKWFEYALKLKSAEGHEFSLSEELNLEKVNVTPDSDIICFTQNETSNGTRLSGEIIHDFKISHPDKLIAVDATSSLGGIYLDFTLADIWFASVQKCLGLPAGLAVMICSPKVITRAKELNEKVHYNSFLFIHEKMQDFQTTYTPNVLNIYLLYRMMQIVEDIHEIDLKIKIRADKIYDSLNSLTAFQPLVNNGKVQSRTVIAIAGKEDQISNIKTSAKEEGFLLGNGYGKWAKNTFRIANFPSLSDLEINNLITYIKN